MKDQNGKGPSAHVKALPLMAQR